MGVRFCVLKKGGVHTDQITAYLMFLTLIHLIERWSHRQQRYVTDPIFAAVLILYA